MKVVECGVRDVIETMNGEFIVLYKWIPSYLVLIHRKVKESRDLWAYVEDEALWFRRGLGLNCTCTVTPFWNKCFNVHGPIWLDLTTKSYLNAIFQMKETTFL